MVREFSEEKRQEIFRLLDEIDNREWKSFMEWCGSSAEEFGDWPDKLAVSAYTRYVDKYHERVLEINEMTRNRVNTVFENVAEIETRYAGRMKECQAKIKEQIAMVRTMTEFMDSMSDGNPNMALITKGSVNESVRTEEEADLTGISSDGAKNETSIYFLNDYFDSGEEFDREEIIRILDGALSLGYITQDEYNNLIILLPQMPNLNQVLTDEILIPRLYEELEIEYNRITRRIQNGENEASIFLLNDYFDSGEEFSEDEIKRILNGELLFGNITQNEYYYLKGMTTEMFSTTSKTRRKVIYNLIEKKYNQIIQRISFNNIRFDEINIYFLNDYFDSKREFSKDEILRILDGSLLSWDITLEEYNYLKELFTEMFGSTDEKRIQTLYEEIKNVYDRIIERNQYIQMYINEDGFRNVFGWNFDAAKTNLGESFIKDLRILMLKYGMTDKMSIMMFFSTCKYECLNGDFMLEDCTDFSDKSYSYNTRGAGPIQLTGPDQREFLIYIRDHTVDEAEKTILNTYIEGFENYIKPTPDNPCDCIVDDLSGLLPVADYIANNYYWESAIWYWCEYKKVEIDGKVFSLNEGIETYTDKVYYETYYETHDGTYDEIIYLAVQYAVNGTKFSARGLGRIISPINTVTIGDDNVTLIFVDTTRDLDGDSDASHHIIGTDDGYNIYSYDSSFPKGWAGRLTDYRELRNLMGEK